VYGAWAIVDEIGLVLFPDVQVDVLADPTYGEAVPCDPARGFDLVANGWIDGSVIDDIDSTFEDLERCHVWDVNIGGGRKVRPKDQSASISGLHVQPVSDVNRPIEVLPSMIAGGYPARALVLDGLNEIPWIRAKELGAGAAIKLAAPQNLLQWPVMKALDRGVIDGHFPPTARLPCRAVGTR
jgi:hypothetical protein